MKFFSDGPKHTNTDPLKILYEVEACDVCRRACTSSEIRRFKYVNNRGIPYVIRCCFNCNPQTIIPLL